jgi:hypothetical protein
MEGIQHKTFVKLLGLQYKLVYKKGKENDVANALSKQDHHKGMHAISTSTPKWVEVFKEGYQQGEQCKEPLIELSLTGSNTKGFTLQDGVIRYKGRV